MKFKHLISLLLVLMFAFVTGCSDSSTKEAENQQETKTEKTEKTDLILATTTSTQDSGLLDVLKPDFEEKNNYNLKIIAVGTGQALEMGTRGEADVLLVHAPAAEEEIVKSGDAINRQKVMYNDFIIVGPAEDPAKVIGLTVPETLKKIIDTKASFVSRGDDSGTHKKELELWKKSSLDPKSLGDAYIEAGQGMGATLQIASEKQAYTLTDRATFLAQKKNMPDTGILVEGDESLLNIYHVMQVNEEKHDKVNAEGAKAFVDYMTSEETKKIIKEFGTDEYGEPLFFLFE
ncbi:MULTISPECIES: extracellular solute-binding protein [unclassified Mesobacillus]|uniref:extracellular solute-binding protein n=1 Tax=unclassified Mesobacillus TaxID=2675270 RepID=UPI00203B7F09|nr:MULTISPECIES: extracellular solute-binding protein [unclassified Mesobacillus]MCM3123986.1 extracellular solute-binding protein [Mesobacillus sp. MER 33]MCM3233835.1 extracellular solute-binding protein [Mesobacillus sp. MER 48]